MLEIFDQDTDGHMDKNKLLLFLVDPGLAELALLCAYNGLHLGQYQEILQGSKYEEM
jgi:hypothetical protein